MLEDATELLIAARRDESSWSSRARRREALRVVRAQRKRDSRVDRHLALEIEILRECALEEFDANARGNFWREGFRLCATAPLDSAQALVVAEYAVDCFQDQLSSIRFDEKLGTLRNAKKRLDEQIKLEGDNGTCSALLARKSAVMRHLSIFEVPDAKRRTLSEARRCSGLAIKKFRSSATVLEAALVSWAAGRAAKTEVEYADSLRISDELFLDPLLARDEVGALAMVRYYRMTYRPLVACELFVNRLDGVRNVRRLLREAPIFAEAVTSVLQAQYPSEIAEDYCATAIDLLERSIASGYTSARVYVDLAFLYAIRDGRTAGRTAITGLFRDGGLAWDEVLSLASKASTEDFPTAAFSIGLESSSTLDRLAVFVELYCDDEQLAEALYRAALRANARDPVPLTNLARLLVRLGTATARTEARRLLQQAQNFADQRFHWWREVLRSLEQTNDVDVPQTQRPAPDQFPTSIDQARRMFQIAASDSDHQSRGYTLEKIVIGLAALGGLQTAPSYRIKRPLTIKQHQIDGWLKVNEHSYRLECKWTSDPVRYDDVLKFTDKVDVAGVSALMVSMGGYDAAAVAKASELRARFAVLLMSGGELESVLEQRISLAELIAVKRAYFDARSDVFHIVQPTSWSSWLGTQI